MLRISGIALMFALVGCGSEEIDDVEIGESKSSLVSYASFYQGVGGPGDWRAVSYGAIGPAQSQHVTVDINVGNAFAGPDGHIGIGLRGPSASLQLPRGRGIIFGYLVAALGCNYIGVAVENFTGNATPGQVGVVPSSCVPFNFAPNTTYRFNVTATASDVVWEMSARFYDAEFRQWYWEPVLGGQCGAANGCSQLAQDGTAGDVFVGQAFVPAGRNWNAKNLTINHW